METNIIPIITAILAADIVIILVLVRRKRAMRRKLTENLVAVAESEGWERIPPVGPGELYRFQGTTPSGIRWQIAAERSGKSSSGRHNLLWHTDEVRLSDGVLGIGPGGGLRIADVDLGHPMIRAALRRIYGDEPAHVLEQGQVHLVPEEILPRSCMVIADSADLVADFLRPPLPEVLSEWQGEKLPIPILLFWNGGMRIRFTKTIEGPEMLRKITFLCEAFAVRGKEIERKREPRRGAQAPQGETEGSEWDPLLL